MLTVILSGCSVLFPSNKQKTADGVNKDSNGALSFTVHYHEGNTKSYTVTNTDPYVQCDFIAPAGKVIKGLFDENGVQYADCDCKIEPALHSDIPSTLYAQYEDVDISYLASTPLTSLEERPTITSFYRTNSVTWTFDPSESTDHQKMIAACLCNPYADLTITVTFMGKGNGTRKYDSNVFYSKLKVCDETIGSFRQADLGDSYTQYRYSGTIKAKQLINGNYQIKASNATTLGYEEHYIKNIRLDFKFNFGTEN